MTQSQTKFALLITVAMCMAVLNGCQGKPPPATGQDGESSVSQDAVLGQGKILPKGGFANLGAPGVVVETVHVKVGDEVKAGAPLLTLQNKSLLESQKTGLEARIADIQQTQKNSVSQAKMQMEIAELKMKQYARQLTSLEPDQAEAMRLANEQLALANNMLVKLEEIKSEPLTREFVGLTEIEKQRSVVKDVQLQIEQQKISNKKTKAELEAASEAAQKEYELAETLLKSAEESKAMSVANAELAVLEQQLAMTEIKAPTDGLIVAVNVSDGGIGTALPPIVLADTSEIVCEVEINEIDAGRVQVGDSATITSTAFAGELKGEVSRKSSVVGEPQLQTFDPLARIDYRAITVVVKFDEALRETLKDWLKLQVDVKIETAPTAESSTVPANDSET